MTAALNISVGSKFNRWLVIGGAPNARNRKRMYLCRCECGTTRAVLGTELFDGNSRSCGCLHRENLSKATKTHGMSKSATYQAWLRMLARCLNKKNNRYENYGGRGITVCERWLTFANFFADMGEKPRGLTLDRKNNNGNYEPSNCRWATNSQQARNKRDTVFLTIGNETKPRAEWCEIYGISTENVCWRLRSGWSAERAVTTPPLRRN